MRLKKFLLALLVLLIVAIVAAKLGENYAEKHYSNRVILVKDKVAITIGKIDVSLVKAGIVLNEIVLLDTLNPAATGSVGSVTVQGIRWWQLITGGGFSMRTLKINDLDCKVFINRLKSDSSVVASRDSMGSIIEIGTIEEAELSDTIDKMLYVTASRIHLHFDSDMNPELRTLEIDRIRYRPGHGSYDVDIGNIRTSHGLGHIELDSFHLIPRYSKYEFGFEAGRRMASIDLTFEKIEFHHFDMKSLMRDSTIALESIVCHRGIIDVFSDTRVPIDIDRYSSLPNEALINSPLGIAIDSIDIKDADIRYTSLNPRTMKEGFLEFKRSYVSIYNVTNDSARIEKNSSMTVDLYSKFTNEGILKAHFDFALNRKDYQFTWNGSLGTMKLGNLDSFVLPIVNMNIIDGYCHGLKFHVVSDNDTSRGSLEFQYTSLKIMAMDAERKKNLKFLSSMANTFVVNSNNLAGDKKFTKSEILKGREKHRGVLDYVWKSLEHGILFTILPSGIANAIEKLPAKAAEKVKKEEEKQRRRDEKKRKKEGNLNN